MTLAQWMAANGYRDERLAEMVGVSRSHLTHIRLGRRPPSLKVAAKLVRITGLPVETFCRLEAA
jgi:transcriptional regulator with XRE-family HTH domain